MMGSSMGGMGGGMDFGDMGGDNMGGMNMARHRGRNMATGGMGRGGDPVPDDYQYMGDRYGRMGDDH